MGDTDTTTDADTGRELVPFRDVALAAYCPRKLYYRHRDPTGREPPPAVARRREVAYRYDELLADREAVRTSPVEVTPTQFRSRLGSVRARLDAFEALADPDDRDVHLAGRDCRGMVHKRFAGRSGPTLSLVFTGEPPETGVWRPQRVRLVAAALALAWERERPVERAYAEYPLYGVVRTVPVGPRRRGEYREALRTVRGMDGPPARVEGPKCTPCEYSERCGVRTRSLRSRRQ